MQDWIEHRRGIDGERLGWMRPEGEGFVVIDLLGRARTKALDWLDAETFLEELGIGYLADKYEVLLENGSWQRVRIIEVSTSRISLKQEDWGDMSAPPVYYRANFPLDEAQLRPVQ
ncbi:hypothetical protein [Gulosibacter molinativorax]|uniref:Nuclease n=1 Tax=Gulosibacter molinativorax TaxID=256821 RepID=A0ABT7CB82_9MICO|nr:hypothetical protein [Gulosibacter molinativorax]MDJ1372457.1 hypothetical protein [Gulosibacter molinativorax]QUY63511.1 Hypotetical protein [Gulosibacter molinativorax]